MKHRPIFSPIDLEVRGGTTIVAHSSAVNRSQNNLKLRYFPQTQMMSAAINGIEIISFQTKIRFSKFVAFEGTGIADNFVVSRLQ
jgi:hypothetical protein